MLVITSVLRNVFRINLGIRKSERCLIFTDSPSPAEAVGSLECERRSRLKCIAFLAAEIGKEYAKEVVFHEYPSAGSHGAEPPAELWERAFGRKAVAALKRKGVLEALLRKKAVADSLREAEAVIRRFQGDAVDAVIALSHFSTSHTKFRDFLTGVCAARYASMPLFEMSMLEGPMNVDWKQLAPMTRAVAARITKAEGVEISTANGSRITFSIRGRKALADTGILTRPGAFGNLPAGEAFIAPVEGTARGRLILDWAPTRELRSPVTLTVADGLVRDVSGKEVFAGQLRKKLSERQANRNIAELGIGTNGRARRPDNILESEKIMGTIHIALGDNSTFGGTVTTPFHQDFVFFRPTVALVHKDKSRVLLMKNGKFAEI